MRECRVTVKNETGLHSRPADLFVRTAKLFKSKITVFKAEKSADAKKIIKLILLNVTYGTVIHIEADGEDEEAALAGLSSLVNSGFKDINPQVTI